jgi:hypothetical protein
MPPWRVRRALIVGGGLGVGRGQAEEGQHLHPAQHGQDALEFASQLGAIAAQFRRGDDPTLPAQHQPAIEQRAQARVGRHRQPTPGFQSSPGPKPVRTV